MDLTTPLTYVKGIGPARAAMLEAKGLTTVEDLLGYVPFRYEDRSNMKPIAQLAPGEMATVMAEVRAVKLSGFKRRSLGMFETRFTDSSRATLVGKWFHGGYLANVLAEGMKVALFGKVEFDSYAGELTMLHPEFEILSGDEDEGEATLHVGRVVPIYEGTGKLTTKTLRTLMHRILACHRAGGRRAARIPARPPQDAGPLDRAARHTLPAAGERPAPAQRLPHARAVPPDLRGVLLAGMRRRPEAQQSPRRPRHRLFELNDRVRERVKAMLPFKPTGAQKRVLKEIADDMAAPHPMNRLLQGDVGSGKTIVAAEAAVIAIENGYQVAVLAPTEILATQHSFTFKQILGKLGYVTALLTGSFTGREKVQLKKLLSEGLVHVAIGTHALIQKDVEFKNLGLAIIDEQHRFGVLQRLGLVQKGVTPDVLVMTATPIPRTLALTMYGDLDVSVIDEMPPGRKPIVTKHSTSDHIEQVYSFMKAQIEEGRQAYVVYPVIEESETQAMKAAQKEYEHLSREVFPAIAVGLMHGRLGADEKESVMQRFKDGQIKILVSTTVIEVGVDVPNASVMVVEQAERFGLAQLHQLRGRVGRGAAQSYCLLVTDKMNDAARERIRTLVESTDGFYISEMDLKLRGPGEFFGTKQSGLPSLRIANILRDTEILEIARRDAVDFIARPPSEDDLRRAVAYIRDHWQRRYGLVTVG